MKSTLFLSAFLLLSLWSNAQIKVESGTERINMSKGQQLAFTVIIPEAKAKDIEPIWKKYVNNRSVGERFSNLTTQIGNLFRSKENQSDRDKLKVEKNGDEFYVRAIKETSLTKHPIDIYARITELPNSCKLSAFFQYTDSIFIDETNADQERIENIKSYIRDFGVVAYQNVVEDQIDAAKKEVSKQESTMKDIESDSKKEAKSIARYETDIQECKAEITTIEADIARLEENITNKKIAFEMLSKGSPEYDVAKKELKELSKEKSKHFSKIKSLKSKIKSKEVDIKSAKNKIDQNDLAAKKQQTVIDGKQKIVDQLKEKKDAIQ
jgi:SMC interacting uncharacterized protein involved in chromosome segregation